VIIFLFFIVIFLSYFLLYHKYERFLEKQNSHIKKPTAVYAIGFPV